MKVIGVAIAMCGLFAYVAAMQAISQHFKIEVSDGVNATNSIMWLVLAAALFCSIYSK